MVSVSVLPPERVLTTMGTTEESVFTTVLRSRETEDEVMRDCWTVSIPVVVEVMTMAPVSATVLLLISTTATDVSVARRVFVSKKELVATRPPSVFIA